MDNSQALTAQTWLRMFCGGTSANEEENFQKGETRVCGYTLSAKSQSVVQLCTEIWIVLFLATRSLKG